MRTHIEQYEDTHRVVKLDCGSVWNPGLVLRSPPLPGNKKIGKGLDKRRRIFFSWSWINFHKCLCVTHPCRHTKTNPPPPWSVLVHPAHLSTPLRHLLRGFSSTPPRSAKSSMVANPEEQWDKNIIFKILTNCFSGWLQDPGDTALGASCEVPKKKYCFDRAFFRFCYKSEQKCWQYLDFPPQPMYKTWDVDPKWPTENPLSRWWNFPLSTVLYLSNLDTRFQSPSTPTEKFE